MVVHILRAEDDLRQLCRHLKALEELKSNILANISHELRTPITIAKGAIDLASAEDDPAERAKYLKMALDALARLNLIVEDVIEAASFKKGATQPKFDRVDILNLITRVCRDFRPLLNRDRINLKIVSGPLPPVKGDPELLRHALRNLISNAIKFNRRGGSIIIEARSRGEEVEVCVTDTGIGIPEDELDKIFDIFYQVDASPTRRYGGTGLGLALVKEIAEAHGGEITVESQLGKGSTFCLTLPVATRP
jgi:signal transduction histidine kinase